MSDRWPDKTVIGLTGNIATGKSVVRRMLEHLGAFGIDADGLAHRAMSPGAPAYLPVVETFGKWVVAPSGQINRQRLGRIVFADPEALAALEQITHPIVRDVIGLLIRRARQPVVVIEAIKLIEAGLADDCDVVWVVDASPEAQVQRLMKTRSMSEAEALVRIHAQPPQAEKVAHATLVIENDGNYEETWEQVRQGYRRLLDVHGMVEEPTADVVTPAAAGEIEVVIRRAGPSQAEEIAHFVNRLRGSALTRSDVMLRFGQKAYMLAYHQNQIIGLAGWQVENLIARVDELLLLPNLPADRIVGGLMSQIEQAANDLQSEIALVFVPNDAPEKLWQALLSAGYEIKTTADLRVPDWREAAESSAPRDTQLVFKRLREDRVLKPI